MEESVICDVMLVDLLAVNRLMTPVVPLYLLRYTWEADSETWLVPVQVCLVCVGDNWSAAAPAAPNSL